MGRRDGVAVILEVVAEMRRLEPKLQIDWLDGWATRGNGLMPDYMGGIWHHTAFLSSPTNPFPARNTLVNGRPDLSGPLCNFAGPWCTIEAPRIAVVAAFPANHAGASGGKSMGPLPVTSLFNPKVLGLEIDYGGVVPMAPGQEYVAHLWGRAVANVLAGGNIEVVRAHAETSITGKWDIGYASGKTYDMTQFRRAAAAVARPPITPPEDIVPILLKTVDTHRNYGIDGVDLIGPITDPEIVSSYGAIATRTVNQRQVDVLRQDIFRRRAALIDDVADAVLAKLPAAGGGVSISAADMQQIAESVADELRSRLAQ